MPSPTLPSSRQPTGLGTAPRPPAGAKWVCGEPNWDAEGNWREAAYRLRDPSTYSLPFKADGDVVVAEDDDDDGIRKHMAKQLVAAPATSKGSAGS